QMFRILNPKKMSRNIIGPGGVEFTNENYIRHSGTGAGRDGLRDEVQGAAEGTECFSGGAEYGVAAAAGRAGGRVGRDDCRGGAESAGAVGHGFDAGAGSRDGK